MTGAGGGSTPRAGAAAAGATPAVPAWGGGELLAAAAAEVAAACVGVALLWAPQERLVWQPPRVRARDLVPPAGAARLDFRAGDGQPLLAWAVEPAAAERTAGTLVAFHGNAELAAWGVPWARAVAERTGWRVVLPEYRGYAGLGGAPAYRHSAPDAWAAYEAVAARWGDAGRGAPLALFGHSLGSAVAAELAAALAAAGRTPGALWARVARVHFDTAARVAELDAPVWVAHGAMDAVVPAWMGRRVWAAARRAGDLLVVDGAGHNRVPERGGARYWRWLGDALAAPDPG